MTKEQQEQWDRVKKEMIFLMRQNLAANKTWEEIADAILNLEDILVRDKDQSKPNARQGIFLTMSKAQLNSYTEAQEDMDKDHFVKVLPK